MSGSCAASGGRKQLDPGREELHEAREWVKSNVVFEYSKEDGVLEVHAATIFPARESTVFEILTHPMGEEVYRGITACVKRKILENDGEGDMLLEVHNKSEWNVLGLVRGSVVSKMLVETSLRRNLMHFGLVPGSSQMLNDMYGIWRCYSLCGEELRDFLELDEEHPQFCSVDQHRLSKMISGSLVTLYQRFEFSSSIPAVLHGAVARAAVGQIRSGFEDLIVAVWRIQRGFSTLPPLMTVIMKEIDLEEEDARNVEGGRELSPSVDSTSAKSILDEKANAYVNKNSVVNDQVSSRLLEELEAFQEGREARAELMADARDGPMSHPLSRMESLERMTRMNSIQSLRTIRSFTTLSKVSSFALDGHRLDSIKSLTSLVELETTALAAVQQSMEAQGTGPASSRDRPGMKRGFFRRVKSMIDGYMLGADVEDGMLDEFKDYNEYDFGDENWFVVA